MKNQRRTLAVVAIGVLIAITVGAVGFVITRPDATGSGQLKIAVAPYQDMAMLMVYKELGLEAKYNIDLDVRTLAWEDIQSSLASAGKTVDVGFGSLIEFLTKWEGLSKNSSDPLVFVHPMYIFKGGGFVTFSDDVPSLDQYATSGVSLEAIPASEAKAFLKLRIGAQTHSMWDMLVFQLAATHEIPFSEVSVIDVPASDAILAAEAGSLDVAGAGVTQRNEAIERGGRVVFTMDKFGFADITGIICRKSVLEAKRDEIERFIRLWYDCTAFVQSDLDENSRIPIDYLDRTSSTNYTVESYKRALQVEIIPSSIEEIRSLTVGDDARYNISELQRSIGQFLLARGKINELPPTIVPIEIE